jgi:hypothetical protein
MSNLKNYNDDNTFILTVIDVFSRFAFAKIIKNKSAQAKKSQKPVSKSL